MRLRRHVLRAPVAAAKLFDKRPTDSEQVSEGALGAELPCVGLDHLVA